jgi:protein TonB
MNRIPAVLLSLLAAILVAACASAPQPTQPVVQLAEDVAVTPTDVVTRPEPLHRVDFPYPPELRPSAVSGRVIVRAVITRDGLATDIEVLQTDHQLFADSVVRTLPQWRFKPATLNGAPVAAYFTLTTTFRVG